jgi:poly(3-hydroxybutyrate) depolymerase
MGSKLRDGAGPLLIWACLGNLQCAPPRQEPRVPEELEVSAGARGAEVDLSQLALQPGAREYALQVTGQGARSAHVWAPEAAVPRALVIVLHGRVVTRPGIRGGDASSQAEGLVSCLAAPALGSLEPIIIAPHSASGQWWEKADTELVLGLVKAARKRWPEAGARSVVMGYSNGGIGAWYFARLYPEHFAAAVPMAFNATIVGESVLPIYAIQGTKDEQFPIATVRAAIDDVKAKGQDVTFAEKYRGSHFKACSYLPELANAARWLEQHVFAGAAPARAGASP